MAKNKAKSVAVDLDFAFFHALWRFYAENRKQVRKSYDELSRRFIDFNDSRKANAYLRRPQFEALEMYVFLKEYLGNQKVHALFEDWYQRDEKFVGRSAFSKAGQLAIADAITADQYEAAYKKMKASERTYPNYIFALTMGTGKTILMATCIFYEFLLANKLPKSDLYCHNALVFAPDTTVLESLREIQTMDKAKVVPPEYIGFLDANLKFHFLDEAGMALSTMDGSRFNIVISNTQKIILKREHQEKTAAQKLFGADANTYAPSSAWGEWEAELEAASQVEDEESLTTNQRFQKLQRLEQLGIYVDEAHHAFGTKLAQDMGLGKLNKTSLRLTIDELAKSLESGGTRVVGCYNYTGTPYVENQVLPEVVYAFGLQEAIDEGFLKLVETKTYSNVKSEEFVEGVIEHFLASVGGQRHEEMLPKLAFFASTIDELANELRPAVQRALEKRGLSIDRILVNVGDEKLTGNDEIREFKDLDKPRSEKQFILLVGKGREGWNCRSLFGVALFREPKSKILVLQATMRCLRSIGEGQQTGYVHLSEDNRQILDDELQRNFRVSLDEIEGTGKKKQRYTVQVAKPLREVTLRRMRYTYALEEKPLAPGIALGLDGVDTTKYELRRTTYKGLSPEEALRKGAETEDISYLRYQRRHSRMTLVAEIARYLHKPCLEIEALLEQTAEGIDGILEQVNRHNEILFECVIPRLFDALHEIQQSEAFEEYTIALVKEPPDGAYEVMGDPDLVAAMEKAAVEQERVEASFHLDTYCFDSKPERDLFWHLLRDKRIDRIYFTGMLTHGQSDFFIQYIDPETHALRSYYPDFLVQRDDGTYVVVEVKADNMIEDPVVLAKQRFAEQMAADNRMTYGVVTESEVKARKYDLLFPSSALQARII